MMTRPLPERIERLLLTGFGLGLIPGLRGTYGTLLGIPLAFMVAHVSLAVSPWLAWGLVAALLPPAVRLCDDCEALFGRTDPGCVVLDEIVAFPLCFAGLSGELCGPGGWILVLAGFVAFRIFDMAKPWPIGRLQALPRGLGVVVDDVAAALAACVFLHCLELSDEVHRLFQ